MFTSVSLCPPQGLWNQLLSVKIELCVMWLGPLQKQRNWCGFSSLQLPGRSCVAPAGDRSLSISHTIWRQAMTCSTAGRITVLHEMVYSVELARKNHHLSYLLTLLSSAPSPWPGERDVEECPGLAPGEGWPCCCRHGLGRQLAGEVPSLFKCVLRGGVVWFLEKE